MVFFVVRGVWPAFFVLAVLLGWAGAVNHVTLPLTSIFRLACPEGLVVDNASDVSVFFVENGQVPRCVQGISVVAVANQSNQGVRFVSCDAKTGEHVFEVSTNVKAEYSVSATNQGFSDSCTFLVAGPAPKPIPEFDALAVLFVALLAAFLSRKR